MKNDDIPRKASQVLKLTMIAFLLIALRVWHLTTIQHETYFKTGRRPLERTICEKPLRGTICDRFGLPLAINRVQYDVFLHYNPIREIPSSKRSKKLKTYPRREYIERLSYKLATELNMNPVEIEDFTYSQAAIFPSTPMLLKADISEKTFFRIKALEKDWPGLVADRSPRRYYPNDRIASHVIGYLGKVDHATYHKIGHELKSLTEFIEKHYAGELSLLPKGYTKIRQVEERIEKLQSIAYRMDDYVGKWGIERSFEEQLRGCLGKQLFLTDTLDQKRYLLPGSKPAISGSGIRLTISKDLQEFAEMLLAENEKIREGHFSKKGKYGNRLPAPWVKGGSIVAMIPTTGEIVACASYPRFDPNDFASPHSIAWKHWLESDDYIADLWDGKQMLEKEVYDFKQRQWSAKTIPLTWSFYLGSVLGKTSALYHSICSVKTLGVALEIKNALYSLLDYSEQASLAQLMESIYSDTQKPIHQTIKEALEQHAPLIHPLKETLDPYLGVIGNQHDRLLLVDLLQLALGPSSYSHDLHQAVADVSLEAYRTYTQAASVIEETVVEIVHELFSNSDFLAWRKTYFSTFLKSKRLAEKRQETYEHPYTEYLTQEERRQFYAFFTPLRSFFMQAFIFGKPPIFCDESLDKYMIYLQDKRHHTLEHNSILSQALQVLQKALGDLPYELAAEFLDTMTPFKRLNTPLYSRHYLLKGQTIQALARAFYPYFGHSYCNSYAFNNSAPLGSTFKVVTAFEGLRQHFAKNGNCPASANPFTIIDEIHPHLLTPQGVVLGFTEEGKKITRRYKGGRLPRSHSRFGRVDFLTAMERSSNIYYSLLAGDVIDKPEDLLVTANRLGLGVKTGIDLPGEAAGLIPKDICDDKSALYSLAIGQHRLLSTPLQATSFLCTLANFGTRLRPKILDHIQSEQKHTGFHKQKVEPILANLGLHFPFFVEMMSSSSEVQTHFSSSTVEEKLDVHPDVRSYLFESMQRVMTGERGSARPSMIRYLLSHPDVMKKYRDIGHQMIGKTSTAEVFYKPTLDHESKGRICNHIWFAGIAFSPSQPDTVPFSNPELVVTVFLPYGDYGKEAAPLAALIVDKWRDIQAANSALSEKQ